MHLESVESYIIDFNKTTRSMILFSCYSRMEKPFAVMGFVMGRSPSKWADHRYQGVRDVRQTAVINLEKIMRYMVVQRLRTEPFGTVRLTQNWEICRQYDVGDYSTKLSGGFRSGLNTIMLSLTFIIGMFFF